MSLNRKDNQLHLVMFPFFAFGHISPFALLSNKLSSYSGIKISFLAASANVRRIKTMLNPTIEIIPLTLPHVDGLPKGVENTSDTSPASVELLKVALDLMQPQIKTLLTNLKPDFVFFDFAQWWLPEIASELGIKTICFSVFMTIGTAYVTSWFTHDTLPTREEIKIPPPGFPGTRGGSTCKVTDPTITLKNFEAQDFMYIFKSFHGTPSVFDRLMKCFNGCNAILIKSCREMEGPYIDYVSNQVKKPVLLVGPMVPEPNSIELDERWAKWLSQFPAKSVMYCSFGSETFLNDDQIRELALGLELTGLPFFLVLNFPANLDNSAELKRTLPDGFVERVKDKGAVHSGWVQQRQILAHESVGCYLCHAGFSSVIEGLVNDCQLVMLPLKGDQLLNSKLMGLEWKVGVEVNRRDEDGYFGKEDVFEAVKSVMIETEKEPAKSIRENHKQWKEFLLNNEVQNKYIGDFVEKLYALSKENMH